MHSVLINSVMQNDSYKVLLTCMDGNSYHETMTLMVAVQLRHKLVNAKYSHFSQLLLFFQLIKE